MLKALGIFLVIDYIALRWSMNFLIRILFWELYFFCLFLLSITLIGIFFIPSVWAYVTRIESFFGEHFALNPTKFSSVQFLIEIFNPPSYSYNYDMAKIPNVQTVPETSSSSINGLKNRILKIAEDSEM